MSSGDILFILAFIVLPTAVLVSSIWAVIFVRRRPDRVKVPMADDRVVDEEARDQAEEDTVITAVVARPNTSTDPESSVLPEVEPEHDIISDADESAALDTEPDEDDSDIEVDPDVEPAFEEDPETTESGLEQEPWEERDLLESQVVQTTEDMEAVVERVATAEARLAESEIEPDVEDEFEESGPDDSVDTEPRDFEDLEEESSAMMQTSELPILSPAPESSHQPAASPSQQLPSEHDDRQVHDTSPRRRRQVRLRPTDPDSVRQRGRSREAPRQVPRLGRWTRRGSDSSTDRPADGESGDDRSARNER